MRVLSLLTVAALVVATAVNAQGKKPADPENTLILELKTGKVTIELRPDLAPNHVERIKKLTRAGFYNGLKFHRVIAGFMAQTGDPTGTGSGGSNEPDLNAEFTPTPFERGTIGAARTNEPNTANSQFFICFTHTPSLNGQYTVWGRVVDGMTHVDQIAKGEPPPAPDKIIKMSILADGQSTGANPPPAKAKPSAAAAKPKDAFSPVKPAAEPAPSGEVLPWAKK